jgi:hypothetical protein
MGKQKRQSLPGVLKQLQKPSSKQKQHTSRPGDVKSATAAAAAVKAGSGKGSGGGGSIKRRNMTTAPTSGGGGGSDKNKQRRAFGRWLDDYGAVSAAIERHGDLEELLDANGGLVKIEDFLPKAAAEGVLQLLQELPGEFEWQWRGTRF